MCISITVCNIYAVASGKVCGLLTVLSGTWRGPDSTDRPIRVLTGPYQELECEDYMEASWQSCSVSARFLPGSCQDCQEALGGSRSSRVLAREQFADEIGVIINNNSLINNMLCYIISNFLLENKNI